MFTPAEVAKNVVATAKGKATNLPSKLFLLGILAGMFIALAAVGANTASCTIESASAAKLIGACVFPVGLGMVLVAGSELFTGNCLIIIGVLEKEVTVAQMLKNWFFVYVGNFVGSMIVVLLINAGDQLELFGGALAVTTMKVAASKASLSFGHALILGIFCNFLVCIAVWISFAAKSVTGKMVGMFMPIMLFVLSGFEHSVANMYYVPSGIIALASHADAAAAAGLAVENLNWGCFLLNNLLPVTIGNIIGGMVLVGMVYWFVYLRKVAK